MPEVIEARRLALDKPAGADLDATKPETNGPSVAVAADLKADANPPELKTAPKNDLDLSASQQRRTPPVNVTTSPFVERTNGAYPKAAGGEPAPTHDLASVYPAEPVKDELVKEEPMDIDPQLK
ncbi:hypothetical protein BpHYR1_050344 [Brachionus plicatilis]|uniref:Uncharacterized protein n=1 Tax=Brachionus plicatilis TaxID=10195 RepID=A0A3M7T267_BRAPC|nr:hypothetical protein BpHYR1_050344 [Brachionus plicatilis]